MRIIGWLISLVLSTVVYVPLIALYTPIGKMLEVEIDTIPFIDVLVYSLIGVAVFGGGAILIALIWTLIWRPFD